MPPKNPKRSAAEEVAQVARKKLFASIMGQADETTLCTLADVAIKSAQTAARSTPDFFSANQLAQRYGVDRKTVQSWPIPRHKLGRSVRYSREDVADWELGNREIPESPL